jgi:hypothetical protein
MVTRLLTHLRLNDYLPFCKEIGDADSIYLDMQQLGQIQFISKGFSEGRYEWLRGNEHWCFLPNPSLTSLARIADNVWHVPRSFRHPNFDSEEDEEEEDEEEQQNQQQQQHQQQ